MNTNDYLNTFYSSYDEEGRLLRGVGRVEYATTMRYIRRYLKPGDKVLEVGAATGRYSVTLAGEGYDVTAVELVQHNLDILRSKVTPEMNIETYQGNALNLDMLGDNTFDLTLVLGPMYHLYNVEDKKLAISEALRATKPGGVIMVAYCIADSCIVEYGFRGGNLQKVIDEGVLDPETFSTSTNPWFSLFELVRKSDIDALMEKFPVKRLHYVATEGLAYSLRKELMEMEEEMFRMFLKYHLTVCENPDLVGATDHVLDIFRKV